MGKAGRLLLTVYRWANRSSTEHSPDEAKTTDSLDVRNQVG